MCRTSHGWICIPAIKPAPFDVDAGVRASSPFVLDGRNLVGANLAAWWFDPRTGVGASIGVLPKQERMQFTPPAGEPDWVLVLDDAAAGFGILGQSY